MTESTQARMLKAFAGKLAPIMRDYVAEAIAPLVERLNVVEAWVIEFERKGVAYRGVWQASQDYRRGDLVTLNGSIWHANVETRAKPGAGSDWTLAVKAGRDGKDAR